jgi:hypothetical protein
LKIIILEKILANLIKNEKLVGIFPVIVSFLANFLSNFWRKSWKFLGVLQFFSKRILIVNLFFLKIIWKKNRKKGNLNEFSGYFL